MTINDLLKLIPEGKRDYFVVIGAPDGMLSGKGFDEYPLIEVTIDDSKKEIILEGDYS